MSISPATILLALPAVRVASRVVQQTATEGFEFASQLLTPPERGSSTAPVIDGIGNTSASQFERLLPQLQAFLKSLSRSSQQSIDLVTDGKSTIVVEGEAGSKEAIQQWLEDNPEWANEWKSAVHQFLEDQRIDFPTNPNAANTKWQSSVRTQITKANAEHWVVLNQVYP